MSWTASNPVSIGNPTKKSDYDKVWDNADYLKTQHEIGHNTDGTHKAEAIPAMRSFFFSTTF